MCDMLGMQSVSDDVRGLWFEVTMDVQGRVPVPGDTTELQNAVTKAGGRAGGRTGSIRSAEPRGEQRSRRFPAGVTLCEASGAVRELGQAQAFGRDPQLRHTRHAIRPKSPHWPHQVIAIKNRQMDVSQGWEPMAFGSCLLEEIVDCRVAESGRG